MLIFDYQLTVCMHIEHYRERNGSVVECLTRDRKIQVEFEFGGHSQTLT